MNNDLIMMINGTAVPLGAAWAHYGDTHSEDVGEFSLSIPIELISPAIDGEELSALQPLIEQSDHLLNDVFRITRDDKDAIKWVCTSARVVSINDGKVHVRGTCEPFKG